MREENLAYDVFPRVAPMNGRCPITVRALYKHGRWADGASYGVSIYPSAGHPRLDPEGEPYRARIIAHDGVLHIPYTFEDEGEYVLLVEPPADESRPRVAEFRLYAVAQDLFSRRPYKGDFHLHTDRSDGRESPAYVAGASRRIGMDFMAITDHWQYAPSLEAMRAFGDVPIDLRIFPGEEVHPPACRVHIVNFGGSLSINERFAPEEAFRAEVAAIETRLPPMPSGVDRYQYAASVWCFERIREAQGLGIFCHPYWFTGHRYDVSEALTTQLLHDQPYDALELVGGYQRFEIESNALQVARYYEERAQGRRVAIVGASDAHGCERGDLFGWYYSLVFAHSADLPELIESVKGLYSVAVEALPGELIRAYGPFRLVRYAQFLLREVMPLHDQLCAAEGQLMLAHLAGDAQAARVLALYQGRAQALYAHLWAPKQPS